MASQSRLQTCLLEPVTFQQALNACLAPTGPLSLRDLEAISLLADATILFDGLFLLDASTPVIRHAGSPPNADETAILQVERIRWDFVNSSNSLRDFGNSPWFYDAASRRPREKSRLEPLGGNVFRHVPIADPVIGSINWSTMEYIDKVNTAAASLGATVVHPDRGAATFLKQHQASIYRSIGRDMLQEYETKSHQTDANSGLGQYREILHHAPLFLSAAVANAGHREPADILVSLQQMRHHTTRKYRELCNELLFSRQRSATMIFDEIKTVLNNLATSDTKVPRALPRWAQGAVTVCKPVSAFAKMAVSGGKFEDVSDAFGELFESAAAVFKEGLGNPTKIDVYRSLSFFNRLHFNRPVSDIFYHDLTRVFGQPAFTKAQLEQYLSGQRT